MPRNFNHLNNRFRKMIQCYMEWTRNLIELNRNHIELKRNHIEWMQNLKVLK
jgi:hypothetical protein